MFAQVLSKLHRHVFPAFSIDADDVTVYVEVDVRSRAPKWCVKYLREGRCDAKCKYEHTTSISSLGSKLSWRSRGSCAAMEISKLSEIMSKERSWVEPHVLSRVRFAAINDELIYDAELREVFETFSINFNKTYQIQNTNHKHHHHHHHQNEKSSLGHLKTYEKIEDYFIFPSLVFNLISYLEPLDLVKYSNLNPYLRDNICELGIWEYCWEIYFGKNSLYAGVLPWSSCELNDHSLEEIKQTKSTQINNNNLKFEVCFRKAICSRIRFEKWQETIRTDVLKLSSYRGVPLSSLPSPSVPSSSSPPPLFQLSQRNHPPPPVNYRPLIDLHISDKAVTSVNSKGDCTFHSITQHSVLESSTTSSSPGRSHAFKGTEKNRIKVSEMPRHQLKRKVACAATSPRYMVVGLAAETGSMIILDLDDWPEQRSLRVNEFHRLHVQQGSTKKKNQSPNSQTNNSSNQNTNHITVMFVFAAPFLVKKSVNSSPSSSPSNKKPYKGTEDMLLMCAEDSAFVLLLSDGSVWALDAASASAKRFKTTPFPTTTTTSSSVATEEEFMNWLPENSFNGCKPQVILSGYCIVAFIFADEYKVVNLGGSRTKGAVQEGTPSHNEEHSLLNDKLAITNDTDEEETDRNDIDHDLVMALSLFEMDDVGDEEVKKQLFLKQQLETMEQLSQVRLSSVSSPITDSSGGVVLDNEFELSRSAEDHDEQLMLSLLSEEVNDDDDGEEEEEEEEFEDLDCNVADNDDENFVYAYDRNYSSGKKSRKQHRKDRRYGEKRKDIERKRKMTQERYQQLSSLNKCVSLNGAGLNLLVTCNSRDFNLNWWELDPGTGSLVRVSSSHWRPHINGTLHAETGTSTHQNAEKRSNVGEMSSHHIFNQAIHLISNGDTSQSFGLIGHYLSDENGLGRGSLSGAGHVLTLWFTGSYSPCMKFTFGSNIESFKLSNNLALAYSSSYLFSSSSTLLILDDLHALSTKDSSLPPTPPKPSKKKERYSRWHRGMVCI